MSHEQVIERVSRLFINYVKDVSLDSIDLDASLVEVYGFNSVLLIELIVALESEFDFEFTNAELNLENYKNVNSIIRTILGHLERQING